ncbi:MAG: ABC transporter permease [Bdellovibrionales bacterium]
MFVKRLQNPTKLYIGQCTLFLAALILIFTFSTPFFFSLTNLSTILMASSVIGFLALGATFVIASGGIDLSSGAVLALTSCVCALLLQHTQLSFPLVGLLTLAAGAICGGLTGFLINLTKAPSIIVTLGMMSIVRAAGYILTDGTPVYGLPEDLANFAQEVWCGLPNPITLLIAGVVGAHLLLSKTCFGTRTLIMGDNEEAAASMGIPTGWMKIKIFALAGVFSSLAGLIFTLRTNAGDPAAGLGYELIGITAVILGGANLSGGRASIFGSLLGVLCLGVLQNGMNLLGISSYFQILFIGIVLLAASFLSRFGGRV